MARKMFCDRCDSEILRPGSMYKIQGGQCNSLGSVSNKDVKQWELCRNCFVRVTNNINEK